MTRHKATPEQWKFVHERSSDEGSGAMSVLHEVADRLAAVEAAIAKPTPNDPQIGSSGRTATDQELRNLFHNQPPILSQSLRPVYDLGREHERSSRPSLDPLFWLLWHHQGASSPIGQPLRRYLGIGPYDRMTDKQVAAAKRWDAIEPEPEAIPHEFVVRINTGETLVEHLAQVLYSHITADYIKYVPGMRLVLRALAQWFRQMSGRSSDSYSVTARILEEEARR